jgi:type II secretory pathway pseudopilin PulG
MLNRLIQRTKQHRVFSDVRGDTIIEVLIAIGIVSLVLTSAYALTNRNAQSAQKTQEQGQAQKLVESQIELMRGYSGTISNGDCLLVSDTGVVTTASGAPCANIAAASSGATYKLTIETTNGQLYKLTATWDALGGQTGNVTMYYRR